MGGRRALLAVLGVLVIGAAVLVALPAGRDLLAGGVGFLRDGGGAGQAVALGLVVLGIPLGLPTLWFAALLGYLYGVAIGVPLALAATLGGATLAFLVARWLLAAEVADLVGKHPKGRALVAAVGGGGAQLVVLLRLIGPHNLLNLSLAASPLPLAHFVLGTALGAAPTVALAATGGGLVTDPAALWRARDAVGNAWIPIVVVGAIALVVAVLRIRRAVNAAVARHAAPEPAP